MKFIQGTMFAECAISSILHLHSEFIKKVSLGVLTSSQVRDVEVAAEGHRWSVSQLLSRSSSASCEIGDALVDGIQNLHNHCVTKLIRSANLQSTEITDVRPFSVVEKLARKVSRNLHCKMEDVYSGKDRGDVLLSDTSRRVIPRHLSYDVRVHIFLMRGSFGISSWNNPLRINVLIYNYRFIISSVVSINTISQFDLAIQSMDILGSQRHIVIEGKDGDDTGFQDDTPSVTDENKSFSKFDPKSSRTDTNPSSFISGDSAVLPQSLITSCLPSADAIPSLANVVKKSFITIRSEISCVDHYIRKNGGSSPQD